MIHKIVDKLFLTDQETVEIASTACTENDVVTAIDWQDFGLILSVGCNPKLSTSLSHCMHMPFPQFTDEPTTCLFMLWEAVHPIVDFYRINLGRSVAIHCVYGQSRSVSTIIAYLCSTIDNSIRSSVQCAIDLVKSIKSSISINPGFLSQLYCFSQLQQQPYLNIVKLYQVLFSNYAVSNDSCIRNFNMHKASLLEKHQKRYRSSKQTEEDIADIWKDDEDDVNDESLRKKQCIDSSSPLSIGSGNIAVHQNDIKCVYYCRKCRFLLFDESAVIHSSIDSQEFVRINSDSFWLNYGVSKQVLQNSIPIAGSIVFVPPAWIFELYKSKNPNIPKNQKGHTPIHCPNCYQVIGSRRKGGNYFGAYTPADMFVIFDSNIVSTCQ